MALLPEKGRARPGGGPHWRTRDPAMQVPTLNNYAHLRAAENPFPRLNIASKLCPMSIIHLRNTLASGIVPISVWETRERGDAHGPPGKVVACL